MPALLTVPPPDVAADASELLRWLLPEVALLAGLLVVLLVDVSVKQKRSGLLPGLLFGSFVVSGLLLFSQSQWIEHLGRAYQHPLLMVDAQALYVKAIVLGTATLATLISLLNPRLKQAIAAGKEYWYLLAALTLSLSLLASATHLMFIWMIIETVSIVSYALVGFRKTDHRAAASALQYFIYGSAAAGLMAFGIALFYGLTGSMSLQGGMDVWGPETLGTALAVQPTGPVLLSLGLVLCGFLFKLAVFPFHFWAPNAYQGASASVAAFISTAPKAVVAFVLWRFCSAVFNRILPSPEVDFQHQIYFVWGFTLLLILTMTIGNLGALRQDDYKRLLGFSGVAQAGFLLMPVVAIAALGHNPKLAPTLQGAFLFFLLVYMLMGLASFFLGQIFASNTGSYSISAWSQHLKLPTLPAVALVVVMVALIGLPPTAGFTSKLSVFLGTWEAYESLQLTRLGTPLMVLLIAGLINTVIGLVYYLRIPAQVLLKPAAEAKPLALNLKSKMLLVLLIAPLLWLGVMSFDDLLSWLGSL